MRRSSTVLSLLLAAGLAVSAGTPAFADHLPDGEPMCSSVWTDGPDIPNVHSGHHCVWGYPYGQWCETDQVYYGDNYVWADLCYPGPY